MSNKTRRGDRNGNRSHGDNIPEFVEDFAKLTYSDYKKRVKGYYRNKKERRYSYYEEMILYLPDVIKWVITKSHISSDKIRRCRTECFAKFLNEESNGFLQYLTKNVKEYGLEIENIDLLPIILHECISEILKFNDNCVEQGKPEEQLEGPEKLFELMEAILKKRMKKAKKYGIPEDLAFDLLGIIPEKRVVKYGPFFRTSQVFNLLYAHADKMVDVDFAAVMRLLYSEDDYKYPIEYALKERKDKYRGFSEVQKKLFNDITTWVFNEMEEMSKGDIEKIVDTYVKARKRDYQQGKDSARRFYLSSIPPTEYERVCDVVTKYKKNHPEDEKYL